MSSPLAHEVNRCTFWTSCTGVSWKRPFLSIMRNFGYSWHPHIQTSVLRVLHTGAEITLKMAYLLFLVFFLPGICGEQKATRWCRRNSSAYVSWTLRYTRLSCPHYGQVKLLCQFFFLFVCFLCIMYEFRTVRSLSLGFRCSVHRGLNNTETMLYCVCFPFLMSIHTEDCCMTQTKGKPTVLEAQQCTFWKLVMETSFFCE